MTSEVENFAVLTTAQTAEALGVSVNTVHNMVRRGELTPALKAPGLRGAYIFDIAAVERLKGEGA